MLLLAYYCGTTFQIDETKLQATDRRVLQFFESYCWHFQSQVESGVTFESETIDYDDDHNSTFDHGGEASSVVCCERR
jgi:hypothetical protein